MCSEIVWEPRLLAAGELHGIRLQAAFAEACAAYVLSEEERQHVVAYVWQFAKPRTWSDDRVPSALITFSDKSLLLTGIYHRHTSASGQSLNLDDTTWSKGVATHPLQYSYHQRGRAVDAAANQWLQYAFSWWVRYVKTKFNQRKYSL